jgi:hypothetical protein
LKRLVPLSRLIDTVDNPNLVLINPMEIYSVNPDENPEDTLAENPEVYEPTTNPEDEDED